MLWARQEWHHNTLYNPNMFPICIWLNLRVLTASNKISVYTFSGLSWAQMKPSRGSKSRPLKLMVAVGICLYRRYFWEKMEFLWLQACMHDCDTSWQVNIPLQSISLIIVGILSSVSFLYIKSIDLPSEALQIMTALHMHIASSVVSKFLSYMWQSWVEINIISLRILIALLHLKWGLYALGWFMNTWHVYIHRIWALPLTEFLRYWALNLVKCSKYTTEC